MNRREITLLVFLFGAGALYWYSTTPSGAGVFGSLGDAIGGVFMNRGVRNRNPGNIRRSSIVWRNSFQTQAACEAAGRVWDADFVVFFAMPDGERGIGHILEQYASADGINTCGGIANRYAPPSENDSASYANALAADLGVAPDTIIDVNSSLPQLAASIMKRETGYVEDPNVLQVAVYS